MSDYSINSIANVRPVETVASASRPEPGAAEAAARFGVPSPPQPPAARPGAPAPLDSASPRPATAAAGDSSAPRLGAPALPEAPAPKPDLPLTNDSGVSLHFRVDRQTNQITVFIVDRVSRRILRSIPPEEVNKLQSGDLLELTG